MSPNDVSLGNGELINLRSRQWLPRTLYQAFNICVVYVGPNAIIQILLVFYSGQSWLTGHQPEAGDGTRVADSATKSEKR